MIADLIKQTVSAVAGGGTGDLTLSTAESPYGTLGAAFGRDVVVRYKIYEAGVGFEWGYGTYTHSGTTFSRDKVIGTWNGTTFDYGATPTKLTFTTSAVFGITADANAFMPAPMGNSQDQTKITSAHANYTQGASTLALTADRQLAAPFLLTQTTNVAQIGVYVATGVDASTTTLGISQLVDGVSTSSYIQSATCATTTAESTSISYANITDVVLQPGWYMCHIVSDSAITVAAHTAEKDVGWAPLDTINTNSRAVPAMQYYKESVSVNGTLDADPSTVTSVITSMWHVVFYLSTT